MKTNERPSRSSWKAGRHTEIPRLRTTCRRLMNGSLGPSGFRLSDGGGEAGEFSPLITGYSEVKTALAGGSLRAETMFECERAHGALHTVPVAVVKVPNDGVIALFAQLPAGLVALNRDTRGLASLCEFARQHLVSKHLLPLIPYPCEDGW